jgi:hypothetical protein
MPTPQYPNQPGTPAGEPADECCVEQPCDPVFEHACEPGHLHPCEPLPICESFDEAEDDFDDTSGAELVEPPAVYIYAPAPPVPCEPPPPVRVARIPTFPPSPYATGFYQQQTAMAVTGIARKIIGDRTVCKDDDKAPDDKTTGKKATDDKVIERPPRRPRQRRR